MKTFNEIRNQLIEGKLKVSNYAGAISGDDPKKLGLKVKKVGRSSLGGDNVEISGPDKALIKFAQENLGVEGKNVRAIQKELNAM
tara:strand:+ start:824 stop:1078 length:255 start_codon:yes stop_codon:yes gene_type:complete